MRTLLKPKKLIKMKMLRWLPRFIIPFFCVIICRLIDDDMHVIEFLFFFSLQNKKKTKKVVERYWDWELANETQPIWVSFRLLKIQGLRF